MKRLTWILALILLLAACGQAETMEESAPEETDGYETLIAAAPAAQVEGEAVSPDGRFEVRTEGADGTAVSGVQPPEFVQIIDRETGEALWQDQGWLWQPVLWSPESGFAALAASARTWCAVTIIETENWTSWEFTLPDGSAILEYTFLPDDEPWGVWTAEGHLNLTIGRGGEEEQRYYTCAVSTRDGKLEGIVWEESRESLPGSYDFDHDGEPEIVELVEAFGDEERNVVGWYEVRVRTADNHLYWSQSLHTSHPGWGSCFACRVDREDYLLQYMPTMYQGFATYGYELFFLDETGSEQITREGSVNFDLNFGSPMHERFAPEEIAAFLEEVHGLLEDSELLLTTENGEFRSGGPGADFQDDLSLWTNEDPYDGSKSLEENIRTIGDYWKNMQGAG